MEYEINDSVTGEPVSSVEVSAATAEAIETASASTAEGHFRAGDVPALVAAGIDPARRVWAVEA